MWIYCSNPLVPLYVNKTFRQILLNQISWKSGIRKCGMAPKVFTGNMFNPNAITFRQLKNYRVSCSTVTIRSTSCNSWNSNLRCSINNNARFDFVTMWSQETQEQITTITRCCEDSCCSIITGSNVRKDLCKNDFLSWCPSFIYIFIYCGGKVHFSRIFWNCNRANKIYREAQIKK